MQVALIALLALAQGNPVTAGSATGAGAVAPEPAKEPRKICRRLDADTGSRLSGAKKVCKTADEWRNERTSDTSGLDKLRMEPN